MKRRQEHVVLHREVGEEVEELEDQADGAPAGQRALPVAEGAEVSPEQQHAAGGGRVDAGRQVEQRRLAGSAAPGDGDRASGVDRE